jgi:hypothetical protein
MNQSVNKVCLNLNTENEFKYNIGEYLSCRSFVPHKNGNSMNCGLNSFGCESIIKYNDDIWKFVWFLNKTNIAVYVNKHGNEFHYDTDKTFDMTRMMEVNYIFV